MRNLKKWELLVGIVESACSVTSVVSSAEQLQCSGPKINCLPSLLSLPKELMLISKGKGIPFSLFGIQE